MGWMEYILFISRHVLFRIIAGGWRPECGGSRRERTADGVLGAVGEPGPVAPFQPHNENLLQELRSHSVQVWG